jgi:hypothetical protein
MSYFSSKSWSCLIALPPTSSCSCGGHARTLPSSTPHHVTLAFALPSCLSWLVVALALVALFSLRRCLLTRSLRLLPHICLSFSLAGCRVTSHCAASASRRLLSCRRLSSTCRLAVASPLVAPPPPASALLMPLPLAPRRLAVTSPLIMPPSCSCR